MSQKKFTLFFHHSCRNVSIYLWRFSLKMFIHHSCSNLFKPTLGVHSFNIQALLIYFVFVFKKEMWLPYLS